MLVLMTQQSVLQAGGSKQLIDEVTEQNHGLGWFIRSLIGLDHEAAMQAFSESCKGAPPPPTRLDSSTWSCRS